jgi:hypothetical protein
MTDQTTPVEKAIAEDDRASRSGRLGWLSLAIAAFFGLFYAYDVWEAVGSIVGVPYVYESIGFSASTPWALLVATLVFPFVIYIVVFTVGIRRNVGEKVLLMLTGLAVSNALALSAIGLNSLIFSNIIDRL